MEERRQDAIDLEISISETDKEASEDLEFQEFYLALMNYKEEEVSGVVDPDDIVFEDEDTEFWEWQFCIVFSNPDTHKLLKLMSHKEAVDTLARYC